MLRETPVEGTSCPESPSENAKDRPSRYELPQDIRPMSNARLGILVLLGAEMMLFSGLIGAFLVFRMGNITWPPPSHIDIQLPRAVTGINTAFLLLSGWTMFQALRAIQKDQVKQLRNWLLLTGALGVLFLGIQGSEWAQLIRRRHDASVGCLRRHLLCPNRMPRGACNRRSHVASHCASDGDGGEVFRVASRRR